MTSEIDTKQLFTITCLAHFIADSPRLNKYGVIDLADFIEEAAYLYFMAHDLEGYEVKAEEAVKQIRQIWKDNDGCWPDEYRY